MKRKTTIYEALQTEVIADILTHSDMNFFRKVCRWYSTTFHTPLDQVINGDIMQWDEILLHYYETQMEGIGYNEVYEVATKEYIPELAEQYEEENREFAKALVKEQKETLKKAKAKEKKAALKQNNNKELTPPPPPMKLSFDNDEEV